MADFYTIRTVGGPLPGHKTVPKAHGWPLPDKLPVPMGGGLYVKVAESELPAEVDDCPNVARGATYHWQPQEADPTADPPIG